MKIAVESELVCNMKKYFETACYSFTHRKTIREINNVFFHVNPRMIRKAIEVLKQDYGMAIVTGGKGKEGYFKVDPDNEYDRHLAWICYKKQMAHNGSIYRSCLPLKQFKPNDVMKLEEAM